MTISTNKKCQKTKIIIIMPTSTYIERRGSQQLTPRLMVTLLKGVTGVIFIILFHIIITDKKV